MQEQAGNLVSVVSFFKTGHGAAAAAVRKPAPVQVSVRPAAAAHAVVARPAPARRAAPVQQAEDGWEEF